MIIKSPSGRTYQWDKPELPTEEDYAALQAFDAQQGSDEAQLKRDIIAKGPGERTSYAALPDARVDKPTNPDAFDGAGKKIGAGAFRYALPLFGAVGGPVGSAANAGGETMAQLIESGKVTNPGAVARAGVVGGVPLGSGRGIMQVVRNAAKMGAGSVAGGEAESLINTGKLAGAGQVVRDAAMGAAAPVVGAAIGAVAGKVMGRVSPEDAARMAAQKSQNALEDESIANFRAEGGKTLPSLTNKSKINAILESAAGPTNLENAVSKENAPIVNKIARQEASIPPDTALGEKAFDESRNAIAAGSYSKARQYGFGQELDNWRSANTDLKKAESALQSGFTNARGQAVDDAVKALADAEAAVTAKATAAGDPAALKVLQEARQAFGKNYDVQQAVNVGNGDVDARVLKRMLDQRGESGLSGGLADIAKFQAAAPDMVKPRAGMPNSPSAATSAAGLLAASSASNPATAALKGGIPLLRGPLRDLILSEPYQKVFAGPRQYTPPTSGDPRIIELITRMAANAEREKKAKEKK